MPSWGRRRRDVSAAIADGSSKAGDGAVEDGAGAEGQTEKNGEAGSTDYDQYGDGRYPMYGDYYYNDPNATDSAVNSTEPPKHVMGIFKVRIAHHCL